MLVSGLPSFCTPARLRLGRKVTALLREVLEDKDSVIDGYEAAWLLGQFREQR